MHVPVLPRQRTSPDHQPVQATHAVVLGASMAGLLTARVLADHFEQVTLVERDDLAAEGAPRKGVPQARHVHVLLPHGATVLEQLLPGILDELEAAGVPVADSLDQLHVELSDHIFFHQAGAAGVRRSDGRLYEPSRQLLEASVLRRVRALANVTVLDGQDVSGLLSDARHTRVTGAVATPRGGGASRELFADLVVSATGRGGRASTWLRSLGYQPPVEEEIRVDLSYVSGRVRFPEGTVDGRRAVLIGSTAERPTGVGAVAQEGGTWVVTALGYRGHHPPTEREAWLDFVARVAPRDFGEALRAAQPLDDLVQHRFPASLRRRYDRLQRFPERFLVVGDAVCSFNPVYGQGMTVAAMEAQALGQALRGGWDDLAHRFFKGASRPVAEAWRFATGADLAMPESVVPGARPLPLRAVNAYVDRFQAAAESDPVMAWRFLDVTGFEEPAAALFSPDSLRRVAVDRRNHRQPSLVLGF